ncbi:MAG: terpene cyclase/mutase family protein [Planctomycetes bacterium]|nr:terpene cyclase/mutase family protein [Planctomycetota bacterium]
MSDQEYYDDDVEGQEHDDRDDSLSAALSAQMGAAPWYVSSVAVHCVIFLILLMVPVEPPRNEERRVVIQTEMVEEPEEEKLDEPEPEIKEEDPEVVVDSEVTVDTPVVTTTDVEISDNFETDDNMDDATALGDPDSFSDVDSEFVGTPALMGIGKSGGGGGGGRFGFRTGGGRKNAIRRGGGSKKTESAVDWALRWLAAHQESDGHWDCAKYGGAKHDTAATGMAVLAFLGAGNSTKFGKYRTNVKKACDWLISKQDAKGLVPPHKYEGAIGVMALAEAYGMSNTSELKDAAQKAVDWACASQCPSGAWDYSPNSQRTDASVAGWWIMGLKSAKVAGLHIKDGTMDKALAYLEAATSDEGSVCYSTSPCPTVKQVKAGGGSVRLSAVGMTCLQFLGRPRDDKKVVATANRSLKQLPSMEEKKKDFYLTYYQALGFFQLGIRSNYWKTFNDPMKNSLLTLQVKEGTFEQNKGSWNPEGDSQGEKWGRVGQTALGALMLEVYYRYHEVKH